MFSQSLDTCSATELNNMWVRDDIEPGPVFFRSWFDKCKYLKLAPRAAFKPHVQQDKYCTTRAKLAADAWVKKGYDYKNKPTMNIGSMDPKWHSTNTLYDGSPTGNDTMSYVWIPPHMDLLESFDYSNCKKGVHSTHLIGGRGIQAIPSSMNSFTAIIKQPWDEFLKDCAMGVGKYANKETCGKYWGGDPNNLYRTDAIMRSWCSDKQHAENPECSCFNYVLPDEQRTGDPAVDTVLGNKPVCFDKKCRNLGYKFQQDRNDSCDISLTVCKQDLQRSGMNNVETNNLTILDCSTQNTTTTNTTTNTNTTTQPTTNTTSKIDKYQEVIDKQQQEKINMIILYVLLGFIGFIIFVAAIWYIFSRKSKRQIYYPSDLQYYPLY